MPSLPRIPFGDRSRSACSPTSLRIGGVLLLLKRGASSWYRGPVRRTGGVLRNSWSRIRHVCSARRMRPLLCNTRQGHHASVLPQVHGIHQQGGSGIFSRPREPIAAEIGSRANDLTATRSIIRLSADNGTIRHRSACRGSRMLLRKRWRVDCPPVIEAAPSVRQPTDRTLSRCHRIRLFMRPSGRITRQGRGCLSTYGIGRSQPRLSDASAHCERVAADIDR